MGQYQTVTHPLLLEELAISFSNPDLIADDAVPSTDVAAKNFKFPVFATREAFQQTDAEVAPTGKPNERRFTVTLSEDTLQGYALDTVFPVSDRDDESAVAVSEQNSVRSLSEDLRLGRERRMATLLFDASQYASTNKATLATAWTDTTGSDPIANMQTAIAACLAKPNKAIFGYSAWDAFRRHPDIIALLRGTGGARSGLARREEVAEYFELEEILVGGARYDSTYSSASATYSRVWDTSKVLVGRILDAPTDGDVTLARHYRYKPEGTNGVTVYMETQGNRGTRGVVYVKVSFEEKTKIIEPLVGYLMSGAA